MFKNKKTQSKIHSNIWKYYLYRLFGSAIFTMPIWVLYMQENGLSLTEVMILQSVYTIVTLIASVPFGALADRWGRKHVLVISQLLNLFGYFIYIFSTSFWTFFIGEIIFGLSTATFFGVGEAFIYDSLKATKHVNKYKQVQGNIYAINDFVMGITGMFGAAIAAVLSMRFTYGLSMLPLTLALFIIFSFKEPKHEKRISMRSSYKQSTNYKLTKPPKVYYVPVFNLRKWDENLNGKKWKKLRNIKNKLLKSYNVGILPSKEKDKKKLKRNCHSHLHLDIESV